MKDVQIMEVVRTRLLRKGEGKTSDDPVRIIEQYWTMEGELIFEIDPYHDKKATVILKDRYEKP